MSLRTKLVIEGDAEGARKAAQDAQRAMGDLQRQSRAQERGSLQAARSGSALASANDNVARSFRNAAGSIAIIHGPLGGVASRFSAAATLAGRLGLAGGAVAVGIGAATFAAQRGVRSFADYDRQLRTTTAIISATGMSAGRTAEDIERLSREIGLGTLAATSEVRQAAGQLLTFRSIAGETFDRTLRLAQDLAATGFGSISSSAVQLARALEEPEQGLTALRRAGVSFTSSQREQIRAFMETGRVADAQRLILAQVERQVGGAGAGAAGGLAGAFDSLTEQTARWFELVGRRTADAVRLGDVMNWLAIAIGNVNEAMEGGAPAARTSLQWREAQLRSLMEAQREHLEFMRSAGYSDAQIEMEAPGLLQAERDLAKVIEMRRELERVDEQTRRMGRLGAENAMQTADRERRQDQIDAEIARLRQEGEALGRTELAEQQLQAVRRAGVALDSEAGQEIAALVKHNYDLAEAQRAAAAAGQAAQREYEAGRRAVSDLIASLDDELAILRESDPVQQEMIRLRETLAFATERETTMVRERIAAAEEERRVIAQAASEREFFERTTMNALDQLVSGGKDFADVMGDVARAIQRAALEAMLLGTGPLARMFGTEGQSALGSIFSSLFGSGYEEGGFTGTGSKHKVAGVVHAGEYVFSKEATDAIGVGSLERLHRAGRTGRGFMSGGFAGPVSSSAASGGGGELRLSVEVIDRAGVKVEAGQPRREADGGIVMPMILSKIEEQIAGSVHSGRVGKAMQQTFGLSRVTR